MLIYACSSNPGKLADFAVAASATGLETIRFEALPGLQTIAPPDETGTTFEENALEKAIYYSQFTSEFVMADDSGLEVDVLGNEPGVYSARFAGPNATSADNIALLLERMHTAAYRHARFQCAIALARAGQPITVVHGTVAGEIVTEARGDNGFGYDPVFFYPPLNATFGELTAPEKMAVSHRGNAIRSLFEWISTHGERLRP